MELQQVGTIMLCSYVRMALQRGKSIPARVRCALVWCEEYLEVPCGAVEVELRSFVLQLVVVSPPGKQIKAPHQAPPLPVESSIALECLVASAHTLPLQVFAGVVCLCVHGVTRWADA